MKFKFLVFYLLVLALSVSAQSPSKILSQANKALGGEKVLKTIRSWEATGKITRKSDNASGAYQAFASNPNYYGGKFDLNGFEYSVGYNGKSGWIRDSRNGLRTLTGDSAKDFQAEVVHRNTRWLNAKADKSKITAGGGGGGGGGKGEGGKKKKAKRGEKKKIFVVAKGGVGG
ncbi:MAG TPA: hypothetical protein PKE69_03375, partial [Pyrinomonadaceae bacterium]|nr:hypothetical protein [Pyrinomonadaceae bacterium]